MLCNLMTVAAVEGTVQSEMGIDLDWWTGRICKEVVLAIFKDCLDVYLGRGVKNEVLPSG